jgi:hypothetical protein
MYIRRRTSNGNDNNIIRNASMNVVSFLMVSRCDSDRLRYIDGAKNDIVANILSPIPSPSNGTDVSFNNGMTAPTSMRRSVVNNDNFCESLLSAFRINLLDMNMFMEQTRTLLSN